MDILDYQTFVWDLFNPDISNDNIARQTYLVPSLMTELLELNLETEHENQIDEAGDVLWFFANICNIYNLRLNELVGAWCRLPKQENSYPLSHCITNANNVLGMMLKIVFHHKPVTQEEYNVSIIQSLNHFLWFLEGQGITLNEVMMHNYNKLKDRHGKVYNNNFYTKAAN